MIDIEKLKKIIQDSEVSDSVKLKLNSIVESHNDPISTIKPLIEAEIELQQAKLDNLKTSV